MGLFLEKLDTKIADELRYVAGMLCMYREREQQYSCDLDIARLRRDDARAGEIGDRSRLLPRRNGAHRDHGAIGADAAAAAPRR